MTGRKVGERGGPGEKEEITRRQNVQSHGWGGRDGEGGRERWRGGAGGEEMEESISNFSAEFTVDSFPIRLAWNNKV